VLTGSVVAAPRRAYRRALLAA